MAQQDEGIMALMGAGTAPAPTEQDPQIDMREFRRQAYPLAKDAAREANPESYGEMQAMLSSELAGAGDLDPEGIEQMLEVVDYINENPEQYPEVRAALIKEGMIDEDDFPAEMDVEYFATLEVVLQEALMGADAQAAEIAQGPVDMMPPQGFAKGGIAEAAQLVASRGRGGDTMLAHITPAEARLLKSRGGSGTINPETGLPEFFLKKAFKAVTKPFKSVAKAVKKVTKKVLASPIGRMAVTIGLTMIGVPPPLASALVTKAGGGSWKDAFKAAAVSYLAGPTSPIAKGVTSATPFLSGLNPAVATGIRSGLTSTGAALLTGSNLKEAVTSGVTSGLVAGIDAARVNMRAETAARTDGAPVDRIDPTTGQRVTEVGQGTPVPASDVQGAPLDGAPTVPDPFVNPFVSAGDTNPMTTVVLPSGQVVSSGGTGTGFTEPPPPPLSFMDRAKNLFSPADTGAGGDPSMFQRAKETMFPSAPTPEAINARAAEIVRAGATTGAQVPLDTAIKQATDQLTPGIIRQYGPSVGAGLGVMALSGGFEQPPPEDPTPTQQALETPIFVPETLRRPMQNLPGVLYDEQGNILGSKPFDPFAGINPNTPTRVDTQGVMALPRAPSQLYAQPQMQSRNPTPTGFRAGGIAALARGGYPRRIGQIDGPGTETSDDIPAMLSDGEFVMTARAVRGAGNGSRREGAKKMYSMMHQLEKNAARG